MCFTCWQIRSYHVCQNINSCYKRWSVNVSTVQLNLKVFYLLMSHKVWPEEKAFVQEHKRKPLMSKNSFRPLKRGKQWLHLAKCLQNTEGKTPDDVLPRESCTSVRQKEMFSQTLAAERRGRPRLGLQEAKNKDNFQSLRQTGHTWVTQRLVENNVSSVLRCPTSCHACLILTHIPPVWKQATPSPINRYSTSSHLVFKIMAGSSLMLF